RTSWLGFIHSLAFYGLLRGLDVHYQTLPHGEATFGVQDGDCVCWLGASRWHLATDCGRDLGWTLWRAFLDAGAPPPTAVPLLARWDRELLPCSREGHLRQGVRCHQWWERVDTPDRPGWL